MEVFRNMVNEAIRIGLMNDASSLRKLSLLSYNQLAKYDIPSIYKLCAISRAAGILAARKKSLKRGLFSRTPYAVRQHLVSCYGFKTKNVGPRRGGSGEPGSAWTVMVRPFTSPQSWAARRNN